MTLDLSFQDVEYAVWMSWRPAAPPDKRDAHAHGFGAGYKAGLAAREEPRGEYESVGNDDLVAGDVIQIWMCIENDDWDWESRTVVAVGPHRLVFREGAREYAVDAAWNNARRMRRKVSARGDTERPDDEEPPQWTLVWEPASGWTVAEVQRAGALVARGERVAVTTVAKRPEFLPLRDTERPDHVTTELDDRGRPTRMVVAVRDPERPDDRVEKLREMVVELWHKTPPRSTPELHDCLGMTLDEYQAWVVRDPSRQARCREMLDAARARERNKSCLCAPFGMGIVRACPLHGDDA